MPSGTQYPSIGNTQDDEDDFGEIRTADSDFLPVSRDSTDSQRSSAALFDIVARFRLQGALQLSPNRVVPKDIALINAFLSIEGQRKVELGNVLCNAIKHSLLRLNPGAVDLILSTFEDSIDSYAYSRNHVLLELMLDFMIVSAQTWLASDELTGRVIYLAKALHYRSARGHLPSWQVRLALVLFVDEYLDYDPDMAAWQAEGEVGMDLDTEASPYGATDIISGALVDIDMRVRFRAATSTAGLLYLTSIPVEQHLPFYHATVDSLPREPRHWNSFITDILWKLNCCITSPQLRAATIYHLYEVPPSTSDFNHHLEAGLRIVSKRLGIEGVAPLYLAHAPLIISSQIYAGQSPLGVPHQLYGFPTRKAYAIAALDTAASVVLLAVLAEKARKNRQTQGFSGASEFLALLCDAAGYTPADLSLRHLAMVAARGLSDPNSGIFSDPGDFDRPAVVKALASLPGLTKSPKIAERVQAAAEEISTYLFALLDLVASSSDIEELLQQRSGKAADVFASLGAGQSVDTLSTPALTPSAGIEDVLDSIDYLTETCSTISPAKILFNTLALLYQKVNASFLVNEQVRNLRSISLVVSLYSENMTHPAILGFFLRETLPLLRLGEIGSSARTMLGWGLDQVCKVPQAPEELEQVVVGLGSMYQSLQRFNKVELCEELAEWVAAKAPEWQTVENMRPALVVAKSTWPDTLKCHLTGIVDPSFDKLCESSLKVRGADSLLLCDAMVAAVSEDNPTSKANDMSKFQTEAFWNIRQYLGTDRSTPSRGVSAFIDLLYIDHGQVQPPSLDVLHSNTGKWFNILQSKPKEDPMPILRVAIVDKILALTKVDDYKTRLTALGVLQSLKPHMQQLISGTYFSGADHAILTLLNPLASGVPPRMSVSFTVLTQDDGWVIRARNAADWTSGMARFLCDAMSQQDPWFAVLVSHLDSIRSAARDLLPLLVQVCLSLWEAKDEDIVKERIRALSTHFTAVLSDPLADTETLRAIVDVVLHLRHFNPPYRKDDLGYEGWPDIDTMLLSEAALKCGSFVTALMFLELTQSYKKGAKPVELYDPRVQKVGRGSKVMYRTTSDDRSCTTHTATWKTQTGSTESRRRMWAMLYFDDWNTKERTGGHLVYTALLSSRRRLPMRGYRRHSWQCAISISSALIGSQMVSSARYARQWMVRRSLNHCCSSSRGGRVIGICQFPTNLCRALNRSSTLLSEPCIANVICPLQGISSLAPSRLRLDS